MIVQIKTRDNNGRYVDACASEFTVAAFDRIHDFSSVCPWEWMRDWLGRWCLMQAEQNSHNAVTADKWISRYQAIRGIS